MERLGAYTNPIGTYMDRLAAYGSRLGAHERGQEPRRACNELRLLRQRDVPRGRTVFSQLPTPNVQVFRRNRGSLPLWKRRTIPSLGAKLAAIGYPTTSAG
jgi:hypothetical protein